MTERTLTERPLSASAVVDVGGMRDALPHPDADDGPLDPQQDPRLEAVLHALATALLQPPDELTQQRHLAAMHDARGDLRRTRVLRRVGRTGAVAVLAILAMAVSGVLPGPLQQTVADAATVVGITLPSPSPAAPALEDAGTDDDRDAGTASEAEADADTPASHAHPAPRAPDDDAPRSPAPDGETDGPAPGDVDEQLDRPKKEQKQLPTPSPAAEAPGLGAAAAPGAEASSRPGTSGGAQAAGSWSPGTGPERRNQGAGGQQPSKSRAEAGQDRRPGTPGHPGPH